MASLLLMVGTVVGQPVLEGKTLLQFRENTIEEKEFPWLNQFRLDFPIGPLNGQLRLYGQFWADPLNSLKSGDLYQASFEWALPDFELNTRLGRFLLSDGENVYPLDGTEIYYRARRRISFRLFGGARRHFEISDFTEASLLVGGDVRVQPTSSTWITVGYRLDDDRDGVNRHWVVGGIRQALPVAWSPLLYSIAHYQADEKLLGTFQAGVSFQPRSEIQWSAELARRNEARDSFEWADRIYTLFTRSAEWQGMFAFAVAGPKGISLNASYAVQWFDVLPGEGREGHLARAGCRWMQRSPRPWSVNFEPFFQKSFGGKTGGYLATLGKQLTKGIRVQARSALAAYNKVIGSNDYALHTGLATYYTWASGVEVGVTGELNSNVDQKRDLRIGMVATYAYF